MLIGLLVRAMTTAGPLVVRNSSMTSLQEFRHLEEVNTLGLELVSVDGNLYSVAVYGLCQCGMCRALIFCRQRRVAGSGLLP